MDTQNVHMEPEETQCLIAWSFPIWSVLGPSLAKEGSVTPIFRLLYHGIHMHKLSLCWYYSYEGLRIMYLILFVMPNIIWDLQFKFPMLHFFLFFYLSLRWSSFWRSISSPLFVALRLQMQWLHMTWEVWLFHRIHWVLVISVCSLKGPIVSCDIQYMVSFFTHLAEICKGLLV